MSSEHSLSVVRALSFMRTLRVLSLLLLAAEFASASPKLVLTVPAMLACTLRGGGDCNGREAEEAATSTTQTSAADGPLLKALRPAPLHRHPPPKLGVRGRGRAAWTGRGKSSFRPRPANAAVQASAAKTAAATKKAAAAFDSVASERADSFRSLARSLVLWEHPVQSAACLTVSPTQSDLSTHTSSLKPKPNRPCHPDTHTSHTSDPLYPHYTCLDRSSASPSSPPSASETGRPLPSEAPSSSTGCWWQTVLRYCGVDCGRRSTRRCWAW